MYSYFVVVDFETVNKTDAKNKTTKKEMTKMKTYIKSLLAIATVALLGSSAQAYSVTTNGTTRNITMTVGEKMTYTGPTKSSSQGDDGDRWWSFSASSTYDSKSYTNDLTTALQYAQPSFVNALESNPLMSNGAFNTPELTFEALQVGSATFYIYGAKASGEVVPMSMPSGPYNKQGSMWSSSNLDPFEFIITVKEPEYKLVENPVEVTATRITFAKGETKTAGQYVGYKTKAGNQYACGEEGKPTEAFRTSDGLPHEKLDGTTQLFVIEAK